jgi:hypothetical protein
MSLALQRIIWAAGYSRPDAYHVIDEGRTVGRIYRMNSIAKESWRWTMIGPRAPTQGPNGGAADSLDEAEAAFRAAWDGAKGHSG